MTQKPVSENLVYPKMTTLFGKGLLMGGADVIPGVSGGTVALIVGVYQRFINAIKLWTPATVLALLGSINGLWQTGEARTRLNKALHDVDFFFIAPLGAGVASAIVVASKFIPHLLKTYPLQMNGFFFGLILVSTWVPYAMLEKKGPLQFVSIGLFAFLAFFLVGLQNTTTPHGLVATFCAGAIAICAMILPGVSGSYLLKAMGQYEYVLTNLHDALALNGAAMLVVVSFLLGIVSWHHFFRPHPILVTQKPPRPYFFSTGRVNARGSSFCLAIYEY